MIAATLAQYGATLTPAGNIEKGGRVLLVTIEAKRGRLRILMGRHLLASGPAEPRTIERFVEDFWMWHKI